MSNVANNVAIIEKKAADLEDLLGEVMATLRLNLEKRNIVAETTEGAETLCRLMTRWSLRLSELQAIDP